MKDTKTQSHGVYLNESERFHRVPLPRLSRCLKALKDVAGVVIHSAAAELEPRKEKPLCLNKKVDGKQPSLTNRIYDGNGTFTAVTTAPFFLPKVMASRRVRKLTPRECWLLMGWTDEQFDKVKWHTREESETLLRKHPNHKGKRQFTREGRIEKMSDSQLYKQAGNGIVIQVLEAIFRRMFLEQPENGVQPNPEGQMEFIF